MQIFHEISTVKKLWNEWQVRVMVLLSLSLQIILIIFGSRRKYIVRSWIRIFVWSAYLSADWVATVALGNLATSQGRSHDNSPNPNNYLQAFWAPFLLLHLGGPDTITAYSLEDNELWLRHFLGFVVQVGVAFYVFVRSWSNNALTFITIPMFIVGIIKYGERTWVLRSSSDKHFRKSLLSAPNPRPEFVHNEQLVKELESIILMQDQDIAHYLYLADYLFKSFKYLFADHNLGFSERKDGYTIMHNKTPEDAFKLVEVELGFMYDALYTKAIIVYSQLGIILRCISTLSTISALISFFVIIGKHTHPIADISITYILLVGAIVLEVYAFIVLIFSDWTKVWYIKLKIPQTNPTPSATSPLLHLTNHKSWSRLMAQYNLISFCLYDSKLMKCVGVYIDETLEKYQYMSWEEVNVDLQELIFRQLLEKANQIADHHYDNNLCKELLAQRGNYALKKSKCLDDLKWTTVDVEFDHSLLLWHIATDLCYYDDLGKNDNFPDSKSKCSKLLSDYMLYLLVICPFMLPSGIGEKRYKDTCATAMSIFNKQRREVISDCRSACSALLQAGTTRSLEDLKVEDLKGDKSVLFYGCKLSKQLQLLVSEEGWSKERKWEMISEVWVEMLAYAASHCGWKEHAQQLRKGGELLTHVCLLMTHIGLSTQYQLQNSESDSKSLEQALSSVKTLLLEKPDSVALKTIEQAVEQAINKALIGEDQLNQAQDQLQKVQDQLKQTQDQLQQHQDQLKQAQDKSSQALSSVKALLLEKPDSVPLKTIEQAIEQSIKKALFEQDQLKQAQDQLKQTQDQHKQAQDKCQQTQDQLQQAQDQLQQTQHQFQQTQAQLQQTQYQFQESQAQLQETRYQLLQTQYQLPQTQYQFPQTQRQLPQTQFQFQETQAQLQETPYQLPQTPYQLPQTQRQLPQTQYQFQENPYQLPQTQRQLPQTRYINFRTPPSRTHQYPPA